MKFNCGHCGAICNKPTSHVRRAIKRGYKPYCNRKCSGLARRKHRTKTELIKRKRLYDAEYRIINQAMLKAKKAAWFQLAYDPEKASIERKKNMHKHIEYCRQPEDVAKKKT